ncbi:MAG: hypothetical protein P8H56_06710 [Crocinitomicaceae bacterium]|nr:hypothetical protein [Crocinitomicaceae bacterium]
MLKYTGVVFWQNLHPLKYTQGERVYFDFGVTKMHTEGHTHKVSNAYRESPKGGGESLRIDSLSISCDFILLRITC